MSRASRLPEIQQTLTLPLCGEPRVAYCYVAPGKSDRFEQAVQASLAERATLVPSQSLLEQEYFGLGEAHPRLGERIGDYTLIMQDDYMIKDWLPGEKRHRLRGVHGGVSENEMFVPLCIASP